MDSAVLIASHLLFLLAHFCACTLLFVLVQRPAFCAYNKEMFDPSPSCNTWAKIFWHGLYTDVKVASYMTAPPLLLVWLYCHTSLNLTAAIIACDAVMALVVALLCVADTVLYKYWHFKIEASVLSYLHSLKGAFASVSAWFVAGCAAVVLLVAGLMFALLLLPVLLLHPTTQPIALPWWGHMVVVLLFVVVIGLFFCVIRGLHRRPDTPVYSYFCKTQFLNHCAVNPVYNFIYSLSITDDFSKQFQEYDAEKCREKFSRLYPANATPQLKILNTDRPNILVVMWESLCDHFLESLGGKSGVMPHFDRLSKEGVYFTNHWAGSFRTDRGVVCLLSGYHGMPTTSIILHTSKLPQLPALPRTLRDLAGYETSAVYGGEMNIMHMTDYYWASGHDILVEQKDFPKDAPTDKWGIHDDYMFAWLADNILKKTEQGKRWFTTFQTLSSHEPFKVPYQGIADNKVDNSFAYVDEAFGQFVERLKASPAWDNLLIVVTGDHGIDMNLVPDKDRNSHMPLLLLGGAVRQPMAIDTLINQTDIAATLLGQMGLPHDDFIFSRDVLADTYTYPFAFHAYINGFVFRDATGVTNFDNVLQKAVDGADPQREENGKVILQTIYTDLSKR